MTTTPLNRLVHSLSRTLATDHLADAELFGRFVANRDPAAFEAIVYRHGPRVLAACRKVLGEPADVEDAFQATFVVLMRNPRSVCKPEALGPWLFGVAHRIALQARDARRRRDRIEAALPERQADAPDLSWREACVVLHEELDRLPDSIRRPLLLCYLEGRTRDEAATELGRTPASVKKGLERGRQLLRKRLTRRGITLSAGLLAAVVEPVSASPSSALVRVTLEGAAKPTRAVATLAASAGQEAFRLKGIGAALAASILIVSVVLGQSGAPKSESPAKVVVAAKAEPAPKADTLPEIIKYAGTVTGPDGKPVKGAKLWLFLDGSGTAPLRAGGESKADGSFAFEIPRKDLPAGCYYEDGKRLWSVGAVLASAPGLPIGWGHGSVDPGYKIPINIPAAVPIEGTLKNLEGQPVAGATVRVVGLYLAKGDKLDRFIEDVKDGKLDQTLIYQHLGTWEGDDLRDGALNPLFPPVTTAKDGTFTFNGLSRERIALLRIEGEGIETEDVMVMTRAGNSVPAIVPKDFDPRTARTMQGRYAVHGSKFVHAVPPSRPVVGMVRDLDTGKPVPGAVISLSSAGRPDVPLKEHLWVKADAEGKYRFTGLPIRADSSVRVEGPADQPYLAVNVDVPQPAGAGPVTVDVKLKRGIWATVRVFDKTDKASVSGQVEYFVPPDNPHLKNLDLQPTRFRKERIDDGTIRVAVLPGPGILAVRIPWQHRYITLASSQAASVATEPYGFRPQDFLAHLRINPPADSKGEKVDLGLTRGQDE